MEKSKKKTNYSATLSGGNEVVDKSKPPQGLKEIIKQLKKNEGLESKSDKQNETTESGNGK